MGLQQCGLHVDNQGKELQEHGTFAFPCAGYSALYTNSPEDVIPWHWHEELEIASVKAGVLKLQVPGKTFLLNAGDCVIINSNIPHYAAAEKDCILQSLVFHPLLITGNHISVYAQKYMSPLLSCGSFCGFQFVANNHVINDYFHHAFEAIAYDVPGFEFTVRENLSHICFYLYQQMVPCEGQTTPSEMHDTVRIRQMLEYIHTNYADHITLRDISRAVNISERECLRCFQRTIQLSPLQYLLKYRIMKGADLLRNEPSRSISEISTSCGFDSPSNFSKMFKRFHACTPREYRCKK